MTKKSLRSRPNMHTEHVPLQIRYKVHPQTQCVTFWKRLNPGGDPSH